jgi:hypothetical protein
MITIRKSEERGHAQHGWLDTHYSFSFADYYDPRHMGFRSLRVINDDRIEAGQGFGAHPHRDMEILTYVLEGKLAHKDSMGENHVLGPNEIQAMSAGTGIVHSEFNPSPDQPVHLLQIWIEPERTRVKPTYQQFAFTPAEKQGKLRLLAAKDAPEGAPIARIQQDARLYVGALAPGETVEQAIAPGRHAWVQVVKGDVAVNDHAVHEGDGAAVSGEKALSFTGSGPEGGEILLFDLA